MILLDLLTICLSPPRHWLLPLHGFNKNECSPISFEMPIFLNSGFNPCLESWDTNWGLTLGLFYLNVFPSAIKRNVPFLNRHFLHLITITLGFLSVNEDWLDFFSKKGWNCTVHLVGLITTSHISKSHIYKVINHSGLWIFNQISTIWGKVKSGIKIMKW